MCSAWWEFPRLNTTDLAAGSSARLTFAGSGISIRMVASLSILSTPRPRPLSLPSNRKSGSRGSFLNRFAASCGDTVPVSKLWQVRQVRPLPPNVSSVNRRLLFSACPTLSPCASIRGRPKTTHPTTTAALQRRIFIFWLLCFPSACNGRPPRQIRRCFRGNMEVTRESRVNCLSSQELKRCGELTETEW